jgi:N-acetylmuramic acid 6-phosphate etherase
VSRPRTDVRVTSPTEQVNPYTWSIDEVPTIRVVEMLNDEDSRVPAAVAATLPRLAALVDEAAARVAAGGRVHYFGAGTSGRLGVLDAAELLPTFGIDDDVVVAHQAGGPSALLRAIEDAEDVEDGADAVAVTSADVVIGLTASGRTPYVGGALRAAREAGAVTALVTSNPDAPLAPLAEYVIAVDTGPEAIAGSTRLKAGTAQKMVLNTFSTALMVRLGHTYRNLMVDMRPTNAKLRGRAVELLVQATEAPEAVCAAALDAFGDLKGALVHLLASNGEPGTARPDADRIQAVRAALRDAGGRVQLAVNLLGTGEARG